MVYQSQSDVGHVRGNKGAPGGGRVKNIYVFDGRAGEIPRFPSMGKKRNSAQSYGTAGKPRLVFYTLVGRVFGNRFAMISLIRSTRSNRLNTMCPVPLA